MNNKGPILIIDDDPDDRYMLSETFDKLACNNQILYFENAIQAYHYLLQTNQKIFLILSDITMPKMSGLELRSIIERNEYLRLKAVPFIFYTASISPACIDEAYKLSPQGFFAKPTEWKNLEVILKRIIDYWETCLSPEM